MVLLCAGVSLIGWFIWNARSGAPSGNSGSDSILAEPSDPPAHKDARPVAATFDSGGPPVARPESKPYPSDAVPFEGRYFKVVWDELSWPEAEEACRRLGGRLACAETEEQQAFLANLKGEGKVVWVGAYRDITGK